jgi:hypothetical protein
MKNGGKTKCLCEGREVRGAWGGEVVKVLRYYSDGAGIDFRWCHRIFQ